MSQQDQQIVWMIKGVIAELPEDQRNKMAEAYGKIKAVMAEYGEMGDVAAALIGAEMAAAVKD